MKPTAQYFKQEKSLQQRQALYQNLREQYKNRLPVIVEPQPNTLLPELPTMARRKYLVPYDMPLSDFINLVRQRIQLKANEAIFLRVGQRVLTIEQARMSEIYGLHHDREDGFLYITYTKENVYG